MTVTGKSAGRWRWLMYLVLCLALSFFLMPVYIDRKSTRLNSSH